MGQENDPHTKDQQNDGQSDGGVEGGQQGAGQGFDDMSGSSRGDGQEGTANQQDAAWRPTGNPAGQRGDGDSDSTTGGENDSLGQDAGLQSGI